MDTEFEVMGGLGTSWCDGCVWMYHAVCGLICSIMRCMTPLGVKGHESHYGANQAIYRIM